MHHSKIVLVASVYDQGDVLEDFLNWYLDLGVDFIIVQDFGSSDGTQEILERYKREGRVTWLTISDRNLTKSDAEDSPARIARDQYGAEWIIRCDGDEFLSPQEGSLRSILGDADTAGLSVLTIPCFNMTGPLPAAGKNPLQILRWRIAKPHRETYEQQLSGDIPVPFIFIRHPPKTIVRAAAFVTYGPGMHEAKSAWGLNEEASNLCFLHYLMRSFEKFEQKIQNTAAWFKDNPHLEPWWGWHWRRWIRLAENGQLEQEYEEQFPSPARAQELIKNGICVLDESVSNWLDIRQSHPVSHP